MRAGVMRAEYLPPPGDAVAPRVSRMRVLRTRTGRVLRLALSENARVRVVVQRAAVGAGRACASYRATRPRRAPFASHSGGCARPAATACS